MRLGLIAFDGTLADICPRARSDFGLRLVARCHRRAGGDNRGIRPRPGQDLGHPPLRRCGKDARCRVLGRGASLRTL